MIGGSSPKGTVMEQRVAPIGTAAEVFGAFLRLGLTAFGGPVAHLGYFRADLVVRRGWLDEPAYAELVALCQFLPGPASSQAGLLLGLHRAGAAGALTAWAGFTLPSALVMLLLGLGAHALAGPLAAAALHGLKLVAVVIVAQAVWGMARSLAPDWRRRAVALAAGLLVLSAGDPALQGLAQAGAIALASLAGLALCRDLPVPAGRWVLEGVSRRAGLVCLALFACLLASLPLLASSGSSTVSLFGLFARSGALVFGGGHVVLPLLRDALVPSGWLTDDQFLAGYGAAQAMPGPLFTVAAYDGAATGGLTGAVAALIGLFLPGFLLVLGVLPFWGALRENRPVRGAVAGANAAVVGILAVALYDPLWTGGVASLTDAVLVGIGVLVLLRWKPPPLAIVIGMVAASLLLCR